LATNTSLFERNPFKDFTTNKLQDLLTGKNYAEVVSMREEAIKYHESLQKGYINRLERRHEASPTSISRQRYELEKWIIKERQEIPPRHEHLNMFDLENER
jgi:hypothetical protein